MHMSTQLIKPLVAEPLEIRCNVVDAIVANLAVHIVFFFERHLDTGALAHAFERALTNLPMFAGRMAVVNGRMRIRCEGQGVPYTSVSSSRTLSDAIRSASQDQDSGGWLVDPVKAATARWGWGPLCKVRVTHLADDATAIGFAWYHAIGDMQTAMHFMNAWAAAAADKPLAEPLIVEDRAAYLDKHLPTGGAREPGVRSLGLAEFTRKLMHIAKEARKQRRLSFYFGEDEIARMRNAYGARMRLSSNDVVCGHVSEALMKADPAVDRRTLTIPVNARNRCGLDTMLIGNILTTLKLDLRRGEGAGSIAERIRHKVDHFADEYCDMRVNQQFLDACSAWRAALCAPTPNPARWNPVVTNWSGFGVYRIRFEDTFPSYYTPLMPLPIAGVGALVEGVYGRGLVFQMAMPQEEFDVISSPAIREHIHRFRCAGDDVPRLHRELHG